VPARVSAVALSLVSRYHVLVVGLVGCFLVLAVASMQRMTLTGDEWRHFKYGRQLLNGVAEADETRMPIVALNVLPHTLASLAAPGGSRHPLDVVQTGRYVTVLAAALFGLVVFQWARELYGPAAGLLALTLYVFDPNLLAHGRLLTNDVYAAGMILSVLYLFWRCLNDGWGWILAAAAALGISQITKYTSLLLFPILGLIALGHALPDLWRLVRLGAGRLLGRRVVAGAAMALVFLLASWLVINSALLFHNARIPLRDYGFQSERMQGIQRTLSGIPSLRVPLPAAYVHGLDNLMWYEATGRGFGNGYLLGRLDKPEGHIGFRGYYLYASLYKVPLATQLLVLAAMLAYLTRWRQFDFRRNEWVLLCPVLLFFVYFNLFGRINIGIRYFLPVFPLLYVFCGSLLHRPRDVPRWAWSGLATLLVYLVVSVLSYFPHFIPYFNELVWDRRQAYRVLADSNVDWGQSGWYLDRWLKSHPEAIVDPDRPAAGTIVVRVSELVGVSDPERFRWLRENFEPVEHVAYAHLVFRVTPEDLRRIESQRP
jgi:4-amino-4-deoxy-L-arabinose transferase-like glycosyltransferase